MGEPLPQKTDWLEKRIRYRMLIYFIAQKREYDKYLNRTSGRNSEVYGSKADHVKEPKDMAVTTKIVTHKAVESYFYTDDEIEEERNNLSATYREENDHLIETKTTHQATDRGAYFTANAFQKFVHGDAVIKDDKGNQVVIQRRHYTSPPLRKLQGLNAFLMAESYIDENILAPLSADQMPDETKSFFKKLGIYATEIPEGEYLYGDYQSEKVEGDYHIKSAFEVQTDKSKTTFRVRLTEYQYRKIRGETGLARIQRIERGQVDRVKVLHGWCCFDQFKPLLIWLESNSEDQFPTRYLELRGFTLADIWIENPDLYERKKREHKSNSKPKKKEKPPRQLLNNIIDFAYRELDAINIGRLFLPKTFTSLEGMKDEYRGNEGTIIASKNYAPKLHNFIGSAIMSERDNPKGDKKVRPTLAGKFLFRNTQKEANELERRTLTAQERMDKTEIANQIFERIKNQDHGKTANYSRDTYIKSVPDMNMEQMFLTVSRFGHPEDITEFAEKTGVNINAQSNDGHLHSALHMALRFQARFNILAILELEGLKPLKLDSQGNLPSMLAEKIRLADDLIEKMVEAEKVQSLAEEIDYDSFRARPKQVFDLPAP